MMHMIVWLSLVAWATDLSSQKAPLQRAIAHDGLLINQFIVRQGHREGAQIAMVQILEQKYNVDG